MCCYFITVFGNSRGCNTDQNMVSLDCFVRINCLQQSLPRCLRILNGNKPIQREEQRQNSNCSKVLYIICVQTHMAYSHTYFRIIFITSGSLVCKFVLMKYSLFRFEVALVAGIRCNFVTRVSQPDAFQEINVCATTTLETWYLLFWRNIFPSIEFIL
jgi:hypothetical protein